MRLVRLMGLDEGDSIADIRKATMRNNAEQMGKQFLLSDREVEVLALYALAGRRSALPRNFALAPAPHTPTSSASTRKRACTPAKRSWTSWTSTRPRGRER